MRDLTLTEIDDQLAEQLPSRELMGSCQKSCTTRASRVVRRPATRAATAAPRGVIRRRERPARSAPGEVEVRGSGSIERSIDPILMAEEPAYGLPACELLTPRA